MIEIVGTALNQWDTGRVVHITGVEAKYAHFANKGDSKAVIMDLVGTEAKIPDYLLQTGKQLCIYAVKDGVTVESNTFPVRKRERPENYVYEEDQRNYIYELISKAENIKDGVSATHSWNGTTLTVTSASGTSSADLKGDKGEKGDQGIQGIQGEKGDTPVKGVDYWTEADKQEIVSDVLDAIPDAGGSGELRYCADCHTVTEGGSYYIDANTLNRPDDVSVGTLFVERVPKSSGIDTNLTLNDSGTILRCAYSSSAGTWDEWEWENPPYKFNKVYRTTERYRGYPVYAFLLQTGGFAFGNLNFTTAKGFTDDPDYVAGGWTVISYDRTVIHDGFYGDGMMESAGDYSLDKYVENIRGDFTDNGLSVTFTLKSNSNSIGTEAYMNLVVKFVKQHV